MYAHTQLLSIRWDAEKKYMTAVFPMCVAHSFFMFRGDYKFNIVLDIT